MPGLLRRYNLPIYATRTTKCCGCLKSTFGSVRSWLACAYVVALVCFVCHIFGGAHGTYILILILCFISFYFCLFRFSSVSTHLDSQHLYVGSVRSNVLVVLKGIKARIVCTLVVFITNKDEDGTLLRRDQVRIRERCGEGLPQTLECEIDKS